MKNVLAAIAFSSLTLTLSASSAHAQRASLSTQPVTVVSSPSAMDAVLGDLERVSAATDNDIADMRPEKRGGWMTSWMFWRRSTPRNPQADKMAASLQHNLHDAMPGLIHDAQRTGAFAPTFKLYNNLSLVCELLDSLVAATKSEGKNNPIANDSAAMGRIRQQLATQIELSAAALDGGGKPPYTWSAASSRNGNKVKRIVVDDTVPQKKSPKKTPTSQP
jgi:hypothetical protein